MAKKLQGAYVQAWVYVDLRDYNDLTSFPDPIGKDGELTDNTFRQMARLTFLEEGVIEIDDDARVSRSYEEG